MARLIPTLLWVAAAAFTVGALLAALVQNT
jgi:hypothetical protein